MQNLRVLTDRNEIYNGLREVEATFNKVILRSQSDDSNDSHKIKFKHIKLKLINEELSSICLDPGQEKISRKFLEGATIFIQGQNKSFIFKNTSLKRKNNLLEFSVPLEVKMLEKRTETRTEFGPNGPYFATLSKPLGTHKKMVELELSLLDISESGMALNVDINDASLFEKGEVFYLSNVGPLTFMKPIEVKVIYIGYFEYFEDGICLKRKKIGCQFNRILSDITIDKLV